MPHSGRVRRNGSMPGAALPSSYTLPARPARSFVIDEKYSGNRCGRPFFIKGKYSGSGVLQNSETAVAQA